MPKKTAVKVNNYTVMPISLLLGAATIVLIFLQSFGVISVPWLVVFSPVLIWIGLVTAAGIMIVAVLSIVALVQIWR